MTHALDEGQPIRGGITAVVGPTNTGKTHRAVERMLSYRSGMIGLPLRLLAREVYDKVSARIGERRVALVTGEEKRVPPQPDYWICTVESMPIDREVEFACVDEIQLAAHRQRGHTFTDRMLHVRGSVETWFLGADTMLPMIDVLLPTATVERHPRFSKLSYCGATGLGALPPRTAVVAFSMGEVYELAERLRQRHGGTAVVLGALSPRTRNAQVAMYEAGEVHYMVATDAIGMGLNLDLDRVVFASLGKFDGRESRDLDDAEMAQIAGRAGRYTRDGEFGVLRPLPGLSPRRAGAIEASRLHPVHRVVWRSGDLSFSSTGELIASLRARPHRPCLRLVEQADDFDALCALARADAVKTRATTRDAVELLWDVCRIPDFRKLLLESHVELLAGVFEQLTGPRQRLDPDWMARRLRRLDDDGGGIEDLTNRIAFVRTWTYIANHERWVEDAPHWQGVTRAIEDRLSDALHRRLTDRFVRKEAAGPIRARGRRRSPPPSHRPAAPRDPHHPLRALAEIELPDAAGVDPGPGRDDWVERIASADHEAFGLDNRGRITFEDEAMARLARGSDVLRPQVHLLELGVAAGAGSRIRRRLVAWIHDAVGALLGPATTLQAAPLSPAGRGLAYQLARGLGTVDLARAREQTARLTDEDRRRFADAGIELGTVGMYVPGALHGESIRLRALLWATHHEPAWTMRLPARGQVSVRIQPDVDHAFYPDIGFLVRGPRAVRVDQLERAATELRRAARSGEPFSLFPQMASWLGCRSAELPRLVSALGYRRVTKHPEHRRLDLWAAGSRRG